MVVGDRVLHSELAGGYTYVVFRGTPRPLNIKLSSATRERLSTSWDVVAIPAGGTVLPCSFALPQEYFE